MSKIYSIFTILCLSFLVLACSNDLEMSQEAGYLKLELKTLVSTNNRAVNSVPNGYDAKRLAVKITNSNGDVVAETSDVDNDSKFQGNMVLEPGTYTISASSAGWDGSNSAFDAPYYVGTASATVSAKTLTKASVTLTQANVKVTVKYDDNFRACFPQASCMVTSALDEVSIQRFTYTTTKSAYFPVAGLNFLLSVRNKDGEDYTMSKDITDVKPRDHYTINYKLADAGELGGVTVKVDDATQSYTFDIEVPRKSSTALQAQPANAWSNFADVSGEVASKTASFDAANLKIQWKKASDANWAEVPSASMTINGDKYTYRLTNLVPATEYLYRLCYNDGETEVNSNEVKFTTETQGSLYNAGFEDWYMDGKIAIAGKQGDAKYWNTSNAGAANYIGSVTTQDTGFKHGGNSSAKLASAYAVIKFAAASIFAGDFVGLVGTKGAKLDWGVPFTSRPSALKGYLSYTPGAINRGTQPSGVGAPNKNENDACQIFCALVTEQFHVANTEVSGYEMSTQIDWQNDPRIVAYGELTKNTSSNGQWESFTIPLKYHSLTRKPTHMILVCSSSKWGDYFYGSDSSVLYIDDFSFEYSNPTVK